MTEPETRENVMSDTVLESSENGTPRENSVKMTRENRVKRSRKQKNERENGPARASPQGPQKMHALREHGMSNEEKKLTAANIEALVNLKRANASVELMHRLTGWSDGTISKYTSDIEPMFTESIQAEPIPAPQGRNGLRVPEVLDQGPTQPLMTSTLQAGPQLLLQNPGLMNLADGRNGGDIRPLQIQHPMTLNLDSESILLLYGQAGLYGFSDLPSFIKRKILPSLRLTRLVEEAIPHDNDDGLDLERCFLDTVGDAMAFRRNNKRAKDEAMKELEGNRVVSPN